MSSNAAANLPQGKPGAEPSMEEILASIRRIIADDSLGTKKDEGQAPHIAPLAKDPEPQPVDVKMDDMMIDDPDSDVLDLADVATVASKPAEVMVEPDMEDDLGFDPIPVPVPVMVAPPPVAPVAPPAPVNTVAALEDRILSNETGGLVATAFQSLQRNVAVPQGKSLEEIVVEMLRPMLRGWLDDHLPGIVERLVKAEIERVARGG